MLVSYKNSEFELAVGLAVGQWKIDGDLRTYIIYPINKDAAGYVEVEVAIGLKDLKVIKHAFDGWGKLGEVFGDDSAGYPCPEEIQEKLYLVWDDGASRHLAHAERLYEFYDNLIEHYTETALEYLKQNTSDMYERRLQEAKANGWDTSTLKKADHSFPYKIYKEIR